MKIIKITKLLALISLLGGCATIVGDKAQHIPISSAPDEADILITDETGSTVFKGKTPTTVTLQKSDGSYWGKKSFTVVISKTGFNSQTIPIKASPNGWYIGGNILFGGLIGWFIVDPWNGAMYTLSPEAIESEFGDTTARHNNSLDGQISIVLVENVPLSLQEKMRRID